MLFAWTVFEVQVVMSGASGLPLVSLGLGFLGSLIVVAASALLSIHGLMKPLRCAGENSIVVYLAFFLPMAVTRILLLISRRGSTPEPWPLSSRVPESSRLSCSIGPSGKPHSDFSLCARLGPSLSHESQSCGPKRPEVESDLLR